MQLANDTGEAFRQDGRVPAKGLDGASGPLGLIGPRAIDPCWRAADHLSVGRIHRLDSPLLLRPVAIGPVNARLLGQRGTTSDLNLIQARLSGPVVQGYLDTVAAWWLGDGVLGRTIRPLRAFQMGLRQ